MTRRHQARPLGSSSQTNGFRKKHLSDKYQHLYHEVNLLDDTYIRYYESDFKNQDINDKLKDLKEQLLSTLLDLAKNEFTERQFGILEMYLKGFSQNDMAKAIGVNQSSITKSIYGNKSYQYETKQYGGFMKKLSAFKDNPQIKSILEEINKLENEGYSFSELYKTQIRKPMKQCSKCKQDKQLDEFYNDKKNPDGKAYWCKTCAIANASESQAKRKAQEPANQILTLVPAPMGVTQPAEPKASVIVSQEPLRAKVQCPKEPVAEGWGTDPAQLVYHYNFFKNKRNEHQDKVTKYQSKMDELKKEILGLLE